MEFSRISLEYTLSSKVLDADQREDEGYGGSLSKCICVRKTNLGCFIDC